MATCKHESKVTVRRDGSRTTSTVCGRVRTVSDGMNIAEKLSLVTCKLCLRRSAARMRDFTSGGGPDCKGTGEVSDEPEGDPERKHCIIGCEPECTVCHRTKKPVGRDSRTNDRCSGECPGYWEPPSPCDLWPGKWRDGRRDNDSDESPADSKTNEEVSDGDA